MVSGCLYWICPTAQSVSCRRDGMYPILCTMRFGPEIWSYPSWSCRKPYSGSKLADPGPTRGRKITDFAQVETWGQPGLFYPPLLSREQAQNERHDGLFQAFMPKGAPIEAFSPGRYLVAADELNERPRRKLNYQTLKELFDRFLDCVYTASGCDRDCCKIRF